MVEPAPLALLETAAAQSSDEALREFVFANPILLKPEIWDGLSAAIEAAPIGDPQRQRLAGVLKLLRLYGDAVAAEPAKYYLGPAPLETLAQRVAGGEISLETALSLAAAPRVTAGLSPPYLIRLSDACRGGAQAGQWRQAMPLQRIALAAAATGPSAPGWNMVLNRLDLNWIDIVHGSLMDVWDGRMLASALAAGDRVCARNRRLFGRL